MILRERVFTEHLPAIPSALNLRLDSSLRREAEALLVPSKGLCMHEAELGSPIPIQ